LRQNGGVCKEVAAINITLERTKKPDPCQSSRQNPPRRCQGGRKLLIDVAGLRDRANESGSKISRPLLPRSLMYSSLCADSTAAAVANKDQSASERREITAPPPLAPKCAFHLGAAPPRIHQHGLPRRNRPVMRPSPPTREQHLHFHRCALDQFRRI